MQERKSLYKKFYAPVIASLKKVIWQILIATGILQILGLAVPFFTQTIIDNVLVNQNKKLLMVILIGMIGIFNPDFDVVCSQYFSGSFASKF